MTETSAGTRVGSSLAKAIPRHNNPAPLGHARRTAGHLERLRSDLQRVWSGIGGPNLVASDTTRLTPRFAPDGRIPPRLRRDSPADWLVMTTTDARAAAPRVRAPPARRARAACALATRPICAIGRESRAGRSSRLVDATVASRARSSPGLGPLSCISRSSRGTMSTDDRYPQIAARGVRATVRPATRLATGRRDAGTSHRANRVSAIEGEYASRLRQPSVRSARRGPSVGTCSPPTANSKTSTAPMDGMDHWRQPCGRTTRTSQVPWLASVLPSKRACRPRCQTSRGDAR